MNLRSFSATLNFAGGEPCYNSPFFSELEGITLENANQTLFKIYIFSECCWTLVPYYHHSLSIRGLWGISHGNIFPNRQFSQQIWNEKAPGHLHFTLVNSAAFFVSLMSSEAWEVSQKTGRTTVNTAIRRQTLTAIATEMNKYVVFCIQSYMGPLQQLGRISL